jgi:hypothetical protein
MRGKEGEKDERIDILFYLSLPNIQFLIVWKQQLQTPLDNLSSLITFHKIV